MDEKKSIWNEAAVAGLVLGAVSSVYMLLNGYISPFLSIIFWLAKFAGCIFLMRFFLAKYSANNSEAGHSDVFRFGSLVALLSALIYAAFSLAYMKYINPEMISEAFDSALGMYENLLDSNTLNQMEQMMPKMPVYSFFINLFYCWLFGTVLSAIFSRNIPSDNPFGRDNNSEIDEQ